MRKSKLSKYKQSRLIELFIAGKFNGIPQVHFYLFLKECEWRFNNSDLKIHTNS